MSDQILSISYNFSNSPVEFRDKITLDSEETRALTEAAVNSEGNIKELGTISTCNRTEFYAIIKEQFSFNKWLAKQLLEIKKLDIKSDAPTPSIYHDSEAVTHLLSVAGGLESMMLGENQILSQVKASHDQILDNPWPMRIMNRLFRDAIRAGKAVRTNTTLCQGAVSVSLAAAELSKKVYSNFAKRKVLIIGAGETGTLVAVHLKELGVSQFIIANRGEDRRNELAERFDAKAISLDGIEDALLEADIVVTATKSPSYMLTPEMIIPVLKKRPRSSFLIIDISSPRNVDPEVGKISEVFLYNIDNLKQVVSENIEKRKKEIPVAAAVIQEIKDEFFQWYKTLEVVPTISQLTQFFKRIREEELKRFVHKASEEEFKNLEEISDRIVRKLLHYPIVELRKQNDNGNLNHQKIDALWDLFHLKEKKQEKE